MLGRLEALLQGVLQTLKRLEKMHREHEVYFVLSTQARSIEQLMLSHSELLQALSTVHPAPHRRLESTVFEEQTRSAAEEDKPRPRSSILRSDQLSKPQRAARTTGAAGMFDIKHVLRSGDHRRQKTAGKFHSFLAGEGVSK